MIRISNFQWPTGSLGSTEVLQYHTQSLVNLVFGIPDHYSLLH
jgi:hypothetical protein